jgi:hypothetical protein
MLKLAENNFLWMMRDSREGEDPSRIGKYGSFQYLPMFPFLISVYLRTSRKAGGGLDANRNFLHLTYRSSTTLFSSSLADNKDLHWLRGSMSSNTFLQHFTSLEASLHWNIVKVYSPESTWGLFNCLDTFLCHYFSILRLLATVNML